MRELLLSLNQWMVHWNLQFNNKKPLSFTFDHRYLNWMFNKFNYNMNKTLKFYSNYCYSLRFIIVRLKDEKKNRNWNRLNGRTIKNTSFYSLILFKKKINFLKTKLFSTRMQQNQCNIFWALKLKLKKNF